MTRQMRTSQGTGGDYGASSRRIRGVASAKGLNRHDADGHHGSADGDLGDCVDRDDERGDASAMASRLVLSIRETAGSLGVSDDLVYEMTARGEIPSLQLGRRRVIPLRAIEMLIERSLETFDAEAVNSRLRSGPGAPGRER